MTRLTPSLYHQGGLARIFIAANTCAKAIANGWLRNRCNSATGAYRRASLYGCAPGPCIL